MIQAVIKVDATEAVGALNSLSRQIPFATSKAINSALKGAQAIQQQYVLRAFTIRRPDYIMRSLKITQFADKKTLTGVLEVDPGANVLAKFEEGGLKRPVSGIALAVPIGVRRNKSDIVVRSMMVRNLGLTAHRTTGGTTQLKGRQRTFTVRRPQGGLVLQRVGRKPRGTNLGSEIAGGSLRILYAFKRSVPIPARLHFLDQVSKTVVDQWPKHMSEAMEYAIKTAKP